MSPDQAVIATSTLPRIDFSDSGGTGAGVTVAVVDSGWDRRVVDSRVIPGVGLVTADGRGRDNPSDDDNDTNGHGTAVTNLIMQAAPETTIFPVRVFGTRLETSPHVLIEAIKWSINAGVRLINVSLGTTRKEFVRPLFEMCTRAATADIVIVAACPQRAGFWSYPAVFLPVIGVGDAVINDWRTILYDAGGPVECFAASPRRVQGFLGEERTVSGASFAAPTVTGLIARWLESTPAMGIDGVRQRLALEAAKTRASPCT